MSLRNVALTSLIAGLVILIIYSILLISNGYFNPNYEFSLDVAAKIAPFVGSCVGVFFTLAGTLLVFENLNLTRQNNERTQLFTQKNQFESLFFNLLTQQRQIRSSITTTIEFPKDVLDDDEGNNFFDDLATRITIDFYDKKQTKDELVNLYNYWFVIYNSDLGHFFRHLYHIVKFVDRNPYFDLIIDGRLMQRHDYIKILRAQLSNSELILLALNGLTKQGEKFRGFIDKYELLINLNLEADMPSDYHKMVPNAGILIEEYPQLKKIT